MTILQAIVLAIVEGLTEFLPVSSTGHMIIAEGIMGVKSTSFVRAFTVMIQFGAIHPFWCCTGNVSFVFPWLHEL